MVEDLTMVGPRGKSKLYAEIKNCVLFPPKFGDRVFHKFGFFGRANKQTNTFRVVRHGSALVKISSKA